ncbi:hypothetical protein [Lysinibacillus sp. 38-6]|uniref:hypothetical protein n=1 Tax=Lysinibacillus sp. 38-6 TaxID=3385991 RepID=UPI0039088B5F
MNIHFKSTLFITKTERNVEAHEINSHFQTILPSRLIEFWKSYSEVSFENGINIYGLDIATERNSLYEVSRYAPEYILIGDDGGGRGLFIKKNGDLNVFYQDLGALSLSFNSLDIDLFSWLEDDPIIAEDNLTSDELDFIDEVKVYVVSKPIEVNKFMMEIRKSLNLKISIRDMRDKLNKLPFLMIENITLMKYGKTIEGLNQKYNCLEVRNSKNVILISPERN